MGHPNPGVHKPIMVAQGVNFNVHGIKKIANESCKVQFTDNNHSLTGELTYFVVSGELQLEQAKAKLETDSKKIILDQEYSANKKSTILV